LLVAIVGGSGAGKTSVAYKIKEHFKARSEILSMDDYYADLEEGIDPHSINFDSPFSFDLELFREHLSQLKSNTAIKVPVYNMVTYRREEGEYKLFKPRPLIICEGLLLLYKKEFRDLFDFSIYIDAQSDERLIRRIERDTVERGRTLESIIKQYRKFVAPSFQNFIEPQKYFCDIILPEGVNNRAGLSVIINAIENMIKF